ncbi:DUF1294 domain-containing protein [Neisseria musculi]|uniref:Cold-shock DNA-binding domain protein n=1 Tax=Neisseria musculi TaxID=1815583 RepID=A0A7H1MER1_9NEIS|nr:DUF1294 domain-containing protein [Neisseria musculi]QNT60126.1 cold-shock DNA-binding domain protein [Neisseria musculi]
MTKQIHYGTVAHWFPELKRGSVVSDDHGAQRILLEASSLNQHYPLPKSGDRISFCLHQDAKNRLRAQNVSPLPPLKENERVEVVLAEWNFQQNGGYGIHQVQRSSPIFILGQFLNDQTRVPESGEVLEGRLVKHGNGQWLLVEADIIDRPSETEPAIPPQPAAVAGEPESGAGSPEMQAENQAGARRHNPPAALPANRVLNGEIISWDNEKGYGFIRTAQQQSLFFHISAFHYTSQRPQTGQQVSFYCNRPAGSEPQKALKVVLSGHEAALFSDRPYDYHEVNLNMRKLLYYGLSGALYLLAVNYYSTKLAVFYLLSSAAAFWLYRSDKQTAVTQTGKTGYLGRVPEKKLHQIGLIGGWPGALLARSIFNHKTGKASFIRVFWLVAATNIAITYLLLIHYADNPFALWLKN